MRDRLPTDGPVPETLVIFDTDCVVCSRWVHFLLRHERDASLRFVNAWSVTGLALAARHGLDRDALQRTYLVVKDGVGLTRSDATLALLGHLRAPWRLLGILRFFPKRLRDAVYDIVARNRYRLAGRHTSCFMPPAESRHRFID